MLNNYGFPGYDCIYSLGAANQGQLWYILVRDLNQEGFPFGLAVGHANLNARFHIKVGYNDLGGEDIHVPVVFYGGCSLSRSST